MIKFKYFIIVFFLFLFTSFPVFASTSNYDTYFDVTINELNELNDYIDNNLTFKEFLDVLISHTDSDYKSSVISFNYDSNGGNSVSVFVFNKTHDLKSSTYLYSYTNPKMFYLNEVYDTGYNSCNFYFDITTDILNSTNYSNYLNFLSSSTWNCSSAGGTGATGYPRASLTYSSTFSNNSDLLIDFSDTFTNKTNSILYYSTKDIIYINNSYSNNNNVYFKSLKINGVTYEQNDVLPTYLDLYSSSNVSIIGDVPKLDTIYTNFSSSNYSNFNLTLEFDKVNTSLNGYEFFNNYYASEMCRGRVNHNNNYYTYDILSCTYEVDVTYSNNHVVVNYHNLQYFNNNVEVTDMSTYDKLFLTLSYSLNDSTIDMTSNNLSITFNTGNFIYNNYLGSIYDNFDSLPLLFKFYLSSNTSSLFNVYSRVNMPFPYTSNGFVFWSQYNPNTLQPTSLVGNIYTNFTQIQVSNYINSSIMIFQNQTDTLVNSIDFIFNSDLVISYNDSTSNIFYYIDSSDTIRNNNISVDYDLPNTNNYDISYYINQINNFIIGLNDDCLQISTLTQSFYDGMPVIMQSFVFIIFILLNIYFVYLLIKR